MGLTVSACNFYPPDAVGFVEYEMVQGETLQILVGNNVEYEGGTITGYSMARSPTAGTTLAFFNREPIPGGEDFVWVCTLSSAGWAIGTRTIDFTGSYTLKGDPEIYRGFGTATINVIAPPDTTPPVISSFTVNDSTVTLNTTGTTSQTVTFTAVATDNVGITYKAVNNGATYTSKSGNNWYFTKTFNASSYNIGSQTQTFTLTMKDAAANVATATRNVTITVSDTTAPTIGTRTLRLGSTSGTAITSHTFGSTGTQWIYLQFTVTDNDNVSTVSVNQGYSYYSTSGTTRYYRKNYDAASYAYGTTTETITVTATDNADNTATATKSITIYHNDTTAPSILTFTTTALEVELTNENSSREVTFSATVSDNVGINTIGVNNGATYAGFTGGVYSWTKLFEIDQYPEDGSFNEEFVLTVTDAAGNTSTDAIPINVSVSRADTEPPVVSSLTANDTTITLTTTNQTQDVTFTAVASDNIGVTNVTMNNGATSVSATGNTWYFAKSFNYNDYTFFGTQNQTFTATAVDAAGNLGQRNLTVSITRTDTQSPAISAISANVVSNIVQLTTAIQTATVTFTVTATDNVGVTSYSMNNGATYSSKSGNNYYFTKTYNYASFSFGDTSETLTATIGDAAGNTSTTSITMTVRKTDTEAPVVASSSGGGDVTLRTSAQTQTVYFTATVTDNVGITGYTMDQGGAFVSLEGDTYTFRKEYRYVDYSFGETSELIRATFTDAAGNSAVANFNVTVTKIDDEPPSISNLAVSDSTITLTTSSQTQTVNFTANITDNVGVTSYSMNNGATYVSKSGSTYTFTKTFSYADYSFGSQNQQFTLTAGDAAGNTRTSSITVSISKTDNQSPSISEFTANDTTINVTTAAQTQIVTFTVIATDNVGITSYSVNQGATYSSKQGNAYFFTKTYSYGNYSFGTQNETLTATIGDAAGNTSTATLTVSVTKTDTQSPSISSLTANSTSVGLTTASQSQTVTFTLVATDNVAITSYSMSSGATYSSKSGNNYYFTKTYSYANYSFGSTNEILTATVQDAAGNTATADITVTVTKTDTQAPSISSFAASSNSVTLTNLAQTSTVTFTATITDNVGVTSYSMNNGATYVSRSGTTYTFTKTYAYGDYSTGTTSETLTLTAGDAAGNTSTSTVTVNVTKQYVDVTAPTISSFSASTTSIALLTSDQTKTVTLTAVISDDVAVTTYSIPGASFVSKSGTTYTWNYTFSYGNYSFGETSSTLTLTAGDAVGNTSTGSITFTVTKTDDSSPTISDLSISANSLTVTTSNPSASLIISATLSDNVAIDAYSVTGATYTGKSGDVYSWARTFSYGSYGFGTTSVPMVLTVSDTAGNTASQEFSVDIVKLDDESPVISEFGTSSSSVALTTTSQSSTITLSATVSDNRGVTSVTIPNTTYVGVTNGVYTFTKTYSYGSYSFGNTTDTVTVTASDLAGNTSTASVNITVTKTDNQSPSISSFTVSDSTVNVTTTSQTQTVTFTAVATDNVAINSVSLPGATYVGVSGSTYTWTKTFSYANYSFGTVSETYTLTVTDTTGNTSSDSVSLTVTKADNQVPSISSFSVNDSTVNVTTSSQTQTVTFTMVATDNVAVTYTNLPNTTYVGLSGSTYTWTKTFSYADYSFGTVSETYTVTVKDAAGNTTTSSVDLSVTKTDTQAPSAVITSITPSSVHLKTSSQSATVTINATITDNVGVSTYSIPGATFSGVSGTTYTWTKTYTYAGVSSFGTTTDTLTLTATDAAGNTTTDSDTVTVIKTDDQSPSISAFSTNASSYTVTTTAQTATITFTVTTTDNVGIQSVTIPNATQTNVSGNTYTFTKAVSYASYSFGTTSESHTVTVTDTTGNTATDTVSVDVIKLDNQNPTVSNIAVSASAVTVRTSSQSAVVTITADLADNRGVTSYSATGAVFQSATAGTYTWTKTYSYGNFGFGDTVDTITVTATDLAGNQGTASINVTVTKIDDQSPTVSSFTASSTSVALTTSSQSATVTFNATVSDNRAVSTATLSGGTVAVDTTGDTRSWTKTYNYADYPFGTSTATHTLTVTDAAGNTTSQSITVTITKTDTEAPTITSFTSSTGTAALTTSSQSKTITFTAVASDNVAVHSISAPGLTYVGVSGTTYTWTKTYVYSSYSFGSTGESYTLTVTDAAGNTSTAEVGVTITKTDTQSPSISSLGADETSVKLSSGQSQTVTFTASASDNVGISSASLPTATLVSSSGGTYTWTKTYTHSSGSTTDSLTLTVTDAAGNTSSASIQVVVTAFSFTTVPAVYTISATVNMNESVIGGPDALGFRLSTLSSSAGAVTNYNLPTGSAEISCGTVSASGTGVSISGSGLSGTINVNVGPTGNMTSTVVVSGGGFVATAIENPAKAQHTYWSGLQSAPSLTASSADSLTASYSDADLQTQFADVISNIESVYSGNMIQSWTFQVPEIVPDIDSPIHQFAIYNDRVFPQVFQDGDEIALQTTFPYSVKITDVNGQEVTVVPPTTIYAMLKHSDGAPPMN